MSCGKKLSAFSYQPSANSYQMSAAQRHFALLTLSQFISSDNDNMEPDFNF